jgi:drug/metabolite transporter (DMT)-like permease
MAVGGGSRSAMLVGILCGAASALGWAAGFVAARHGIDTGLNPSDLVVHRFVWGGIAFLPLLARQGLSDLGGTGWKRGIALTFTGGLPLALFSYSGFIIVPLGHGAVIQPSCAALGGIVLASVVLKEPLPASRIAGAAIIIAGLVLLAAEALTTIGLHGVAGDLSFAAAGSLFAVFGMLLRLWRISPTHAAAVVCVVALGYVPVHAVLFGFASMAAAGWGENLTQAVAQGLLAGPFAILFYTRSVVLLGASRAAVFPALVPAFTLLIGMFVLGEMPSFAQLAGLAAVGIGFRYAMKA